MKTKKEVKKSARVAKATPAKKVASKISTSRTRAAEVKRVAVKSKSVKKASPKKQHTISAVKKSVGAKKMGERKLSSIKRSIYMAFSIVLGLLIGTFVQLFVELVYMRKMMSVISSPQVHYFMGIPSYLPSIVQGFFLLAGLAFGIWLGFWGWRFVYIEKRHRSTRNC